jgi:hypothetical protein
MIINEDYIDRRLDIMDRVCAEFQYEGDGSPIHSDICPHNCDAKHMTEKYRAFLHSCLDEWLDNSNGTGGFIIGDADFRSLYISEEE